MSRKIATVVPTVDTIGVWATSLQPQRRSGHAWMVLADRPIDHTDHSEFRATVPCWIACEGDGTSMEEALIRPVVFDVGETLSDDTREFGAWADWIGVPRHTFSAVLGAVTAAGRNNAETFQYFRPRFDLHHERMLRKDQCDCWCIYSQPSRARAGGARGHLLGGHRRQSDPACRRPSPIFPATTSRRRANGGGETGPGVFDRIAEFAPVDREEIMYVGDHRDNDIVPAGAFGFRAALVRRGPWGHLWADDPLVRENADFVVESLDGLVDLWGQQAS